MAHFTLNRLFKTTRRPQRVRHQAIETVEQRVFLSATSTPDPNFGNDGLQAIELSGAQRSSTSTDVGLVAVGDKYYGIAEYTTGVQIFARDASGAADTTFGSDGFVSPSELGFNYHVESIAAQSNGKLIIGGSSGSWWSEGSGDFAFMRVNPNGTLDASFGSGGIQVVDGNYNDYGLRSIVVRPNDQIVAVGTSQLFTGIDYIALMQLGANGAPDVNFGDGNPGINLSGYDTEARNVTLDEHNDRIVVTGIQRVPGLPESNISVHQFKDNGLEDALFGGGDAVEEVGLSNSYEEVYGVAFSGGWIYLSGWRFDTAENEYEDYIARVSRGPGNSANPTGEWDESFGGDGFKDINMFGLSILSAPDGGFYLGGETSTSASTFGLKIEKYTAQGTRDNSFDTTSLPISGWTVGGSQLIRDDNGGLVFARDISPVEANTPTLHLARFATGPTFAMLDDGILTVTGTDEKDSISVSQSGSQITAMLNGQKASFPADLVQNIRVSAGAGNDNVKLSTTMSVTVYGEEGADRIKGSNGADFLYGGQGSDNISGGNGADFLSGGSGNDVLNGGKGQDYIIGDAGADVIKGGSGNDEVHAGPGNDKITGNNGNDLLYGDDGDDIISGSGGNDTIHGGSGNDTLKGNGGSDSLFGEAGVDALFGSKRHDLLDFGPQ